MCVPFASNIVSTWLFSCEQATMILFCSVHRTLCLWNWIGQSSFLPGLCRLTNQEHSFLSAIGIALCACPPGSRSPAEELWGSCSTNTGRRCVRCGCANLAGTCEKSCGVHTSQPWGRPTGLVANCQIPSDFSRAMAIYTS